MKLKGHVLDRWRGKPPSAAGAAAPRQQVEVIPAPGCRSAAHRIACQPKSFPICDSSPRATQSKMATWYTAQHCEDTERAEKLTVTQKCMNVPSILRTGSLREQLWKNSAQAIIRFHVLKKKQLIYASYSDTYVPAYSSNLLKNSFKYLYFNRRWNKNSFQQEKNSNCVR